MIILDKLITELTTTEPVTVAEVKTHLNITDTAWDTEIGGLIVQCRKALEDHTGRSLIYKRVVLYADLDKEWWLPYSPVIGIEGVSTSDLSVGSGIPDFTSLTTGWQITGGDQPKFISGSPYRHRITYTVGYTSANFPANLKLALLNEIYHRFENKGQTGNEVSESAQALAAPFIDYANRI